MEGGPILLSLLLTVSSVSAHASRTSLLTRLIGDAATDTSGVDFVVNVTYTITLPGVYPGCGRLVTAPLKTPSSISIDPLSNTVYSPFDLREKPEVTWPGEANALYTVMLYDAGLYFIHSIYVNVKGGRLQEDLETYCAVFTHALQDPHVYTDREAGDCL